MAVECGFRPRDVLDMTLPEIDLICRHDPDGKKQGGAPKPPGYGSADWALALLKEQQAVPAREKLLKRLKERDGSDSKLW